MDEIIPWDEWVGVIRPYYPKGKRGRPPMGIEKMLRTQAADWCIPLRSLRRMSMTSHRPLH